MRTPNPGTRGFCSRKSYLLSRQQWLSLGSSKGKTWGKLRTLRLDAGSLANPSIIHFPTSYTVIFSVTSSQPAARLMLFFSLSTISRRNSRPLCSMQCFCPDGLFHIFCQSFPPPSHGAFEVSQFGTAPEGSGVSKEMASLDLPNRFFLV